MKKSYDHLLSTFEPADYRILLFTLLFFCLLAHFSTAALTDNIWSYYKLDVDTPVNTVIADATNNKNATNEDSLTFTESAKINGGYNVNATADIALDIGKRPIGQDMTLCLWVKKRIASGYPAAGYKAIAGTNAAGAYYNLVFQDSKADKIQWNFATDGSNYISYVCNTALTDTNWHYVCAVKSGAAGSLYIDNTNCTTQQSSSGTVTVINTGVNMSIGAQYGIAGQTFNGTIDEIGYWNRTLSASEISTLYNSAAGLQYPFVSKTVTFVNQTPADITSTNAFNIGANITYNYSGFAAGYNTTLFYKINSTLQACIISANMTCQLQNDTYTTISNLSATNNISLFQLRDNTVYPGRYIYPNNTYLEDATKSFFNLTGGNDWIKATIYNISTNVQYNFLEIYPNVTAGSSALNIYYCNSSYATGSPVTNGNCILIYTLPAIFSYNHSHGNGKSWHVLIPFLINNSKISNVTVSSNSTFAFNTAGWRFAYIPNITMPSVFRSSNNNGNTWADISGSPDMHVHQFSGSSQLCYKAQGKDGSDEINSSVRCDNLDLSPISPIPGVITSPVNQSYNTDITINWTPCTAINSTLLYYNVSLLNNDQTLNKTLQGNNSLNLSYLMNISGITDAQYIVRVVCYDNNSQSSTMLSPAFKIDRILPVLTWIFPLISNTSTATVNVSVNIDINCSDANLYAYNVSVNDPFGALAANWTLSGINSTTARLYQAFTPTSTGTYSVNFTCDDSHTTAIMPDVLEKTSNFAKKEQKFVFKRDTYDLDNETITVESAVTIIYDSPYNLASQGSQKVSDRYRLDYAFLGIDKNASVVNHVFRVYCNDLRIMRNSGYKGHIVCYEDKAWIDFESPDILSAEAKKCGKDCAEIKLQARSVDHIYFNSLGGLNEISQKAIFTVNAAATGTNTTISYFSCPATIEGQMSLWLIGAFIVLFIILALTLFSHTWAGAIIGFACSISLLFYSAIIYACFNIFGIFLALIALLLMGVFLLSPIDMKAYG